MLSEVVGGGEEICLRGRLSWRKGVRFYFLTFLCRIIWNILEFGTLILMACNLLKKLMSPYLVLKI